MAGELANCIEILAKVLRKLQPNKVTRSPEVCWNWISENWPVLHIPIYANVFTLAFCYYDAINRTLIDPNSKLTGLKELVEEVAQDFLIPHEHWGEFPECDDKRKHHIFVADQNQVDRWRKHRRFWAGSVFNYKHNFVLVKCSTTLPNPNINWDDLLSFLKDQEHILIVSDLAAEADRLRETIIRKVCECYGAEQNQIKSIEITSPDKRKLQEVLATYALGKSQSCRLLLFGTPYCDLLKDSGTYTTVTYDSDEIPTYVCWLSSSTSEPVPHLRAFYDFFRELFDNGRPLHTSFTAATVDIGNEFHKVARAFQRLAEVKGRILRVGIDSQSFTKHFCSCVDHCEPAAAFKIERRGG